MFTLKANLVSPTKYSIRCPYYMTPQFIIVHNTANDASAWNEVSYMIGNGNQTSFHYAVDDKEVVQGIPLDRNTWNAGDGGYGEGNRKGISIEICYSKSGGERFEQAEQNAAMLIAQLLIERNWSIDKVKKHQDFNGKYCPHRTLDLGWDRFLNMIQELLTPQGQTESAPLNSEGLYYRGHSEASGDLPMVRDGQICGTTGQGKRLEGLYLDTSKLSYKLLLTAKVHIEGIGWVLYEDITAETLLGTKGKALRIEAIEIKAIGLPSDKILHYQVHIEDYGWTGAIPNGFTAGTVGIAKAIEAIKIWID